jgi:hypothetical protein
MSGNRERERLTPLVYSSIESIQFKRDILL